TCLILFFQAEDGIRARNVTGVQTCALPISTGAQGPAGPAGSQGPQGPGATTLTYDANATASPPAEPIGAILGDTLSATCDLKGKIGRASCRERAKILVAAVGLKKSQLRYDR